MGYETKMYVVRKWDFCDPPSGEELASIDLCKCGSGAVGTLIANHTHKAKKGEKPPFTLYARNPDRQDEAVEILREAVEKDIGFECWHDTTEALEKLSNHIEDGTISEDKYGSFLGIIDVDDMIAALEKDYKEEGYRRFKWALDLLKSIKETWSEDLTIITYGH